MRPKGGMSDCIIPGGRSVPGNKLYSVAVTALEWK